MATHDCTLDPPNEVGECEGLPDDGYDCGEPITWVIVDPPYECTHTCDAHLPRYLASHPSMGARVTLVRPL